MSRFKTNLIPDGAQSYFKASPDVLVVEDNRLMAELFLDILGGVGFNVTVAPDGMTALATLQTQDVDFIILDILLPGMDGFEVYRRLQANPKTRIIPVLVTTSLDDRRYFFKARSLGVRHYLGRPFTENELLEAILALLVAQEKSVIS